MPGRKPLQAPRSAGFVDAWQALRGDEPGPTFESPRPDRRIDCVWVDEALRDALRRIERAGASNGDDAESRSDHLGLVVELASS